MVDSGDHNTIAGLQQMLTVVETQFDAAIEDHVEIESVRVMHRARDVGLEVNDAPVDEAGSDSQVGEATMSFRPGWRRSGLSRVDRRRQNPSW
jgi:hypothetical protein